MSPVSAPTPTLYVNNNSSVQTENQFLDYVDVGRGQVFLMFILFVYVVYLNYVSFTNKDLKKYVKTESSVYKEEISWIAGNNTTCVNLTLHLYVEINNKIYNIHHMLNNMCTEKEVLESNMLYNDNNTTIFYYDLCYYDLCYFEQYGKIDGIFSKNEIKDIYVSETIISCIIRKVIEPISKK